MKFWFVMFVFAVVSVTAPFTAAPVFAQDQPTASAPASDPVAELKQQVTKQDATITSLQQQIQALMQQQRPAAPEQSPVEKLEAAIASLVNVKRAACQSKKGGRGKFSYTLDMETGKMVSTCAGN